MTDTPQYRLLEDSFFAPDLLLAGSIIATDATPGPHMEPWNDAAKARFDAWLNEEWDEIDPKTKDKTGKKWKPHAKYRRVEYVPTAQQTAQVLQAPEASDAHGLTLGELSVRKATDQRPGPARRFKAVSPVEDAPVPAPSVTVEPVPAPEPAAKVVAAAPPSTTVSGGPGKS